MKYLVSAVVFILLFIVPAGSWYYLQSGLDYRKEALKELEPKGAFDADGFDVTQLKGKTTLLQLKPIDDEVLPAVFDQYGSSETYQMLTVQSPSELLPNWNVIPTMVATTISSKYNNAGMMLVDTSGMVRNTYLADAEGVKKMIEHTSIILPRVKEMDIKLKGNGRK